MATKADARCHRQPPLNGNGRLLGILPAMETGTPNEQEVQQQLLTSNGEWNEKCAIDYVPQAAN